MGSGAVYFAGVVAWGLALAVVSQIAMWLHDWTGNLIAPASVSVVLVLLFAASRVPFTKHRKQNPVKRRGQRAQDFPPPYPNGWFALIASHELKPGEVKPVAANGHQLVVFRRRDGRAAVLDAYCPHLGANLGIGGTVTKSGCIKCPFHGWEFNLEGKCTAVAGTDCIPSSSSVRAYHSRETLGAIMYWHHAGGKEPQWEPDAYPYIDDGSFYLAGYTTSFVNTHVREIPENGSDAAHLNVLHKDFIVTQLQPAGVAHRWSATWKPHEKEEHKSEIFLTQAFTLFGVHVPGTYITTNINQMGPGIVSLQLLTPVGKVHVLELVTPIAPMEQRVIHLMFASPVVPRPLASFMTWALDGQFHRDQPIWETKRMATRPVISKADGPIMEYRRWWQRFYSPESMSFADAVAKEAMFDW